MNLQHWIILLLTATLFGSSFLFINIAVVEIPPMSFAAARVAVAALVMSFFLRLKGERLPRSGKSWGALFVLGALTAAIPYFAIAWGQTRIASSLGGILFATIPVFTVLIAPMMLNEGKLTVPKALGIAIAFGGVILTVGVAALNDISSQMSGATVTLLAALSYAMGNIYARLQGDISPVVMAGGQLITGSIILVPLALFIDGAGFSNASSLALTSVVIVAVFSTALPVLMMFWLVRNAGATNASNLAFFIPVAAVILGALVLGEAISIATIAGFVLILFGALVATGTLSRLAPSSR